MTAVAKTLTAATPVFAEMVAEYTASGLADIDRQRLASWRPEPSLWSRIKPLVAMQAGARLHRAEVDGHDFHYWDSGEASKPTLVLIHGFGASKENWPYLAAKLRGRYRILAPDLPGFGSSSYFPDSDYRMDTQAHRLMQWLDQLGIADAWFAGSSMGGGITALIAGHYPERVKGICLMNAAGVPSTRLSMLEMGVLAGRNYLVAENLRGTRQLFRTCLHSNARTLGNVFALLMAGDMRRRSIVNHAIFYDLVHSLDAVYQSLAQITAPCLVLWGDSDQVLDPSCVDGFLARIPQARAMIMPEVGHLPMLEKPVETAIALESFWSAPAHTTRPEQATRPAQTARKTQ